MFNASTTRLTLIDRAAFQPTIRREKQSVTNAAYTTPDHVEQYVKSQTHLRSGAVAVKSLFNRSGARRAALSGWVVNRFLARLAPRIPA
jgi:hypothetical protein